MEETITKLFANERETNLASTVAMVEAVLIDLDHIVEDCRRIVADTAASWALRKGSAQISIDIVSHEVFWQIRVSAVVMTLTDTNKVDLFERLLILNATKVTSAAFALVGDEIQLLSQRSTLDLDHSELRSLVDVVRIFADEYDDILVAEFGGVLGKIASTPPAIPGS